MANYDLLGNIAVVKFKRGVKAGAKKRFAFLLMRKHRIVKTVLEKTEGFHGRLRKQKTKLVAGEKTREALYRENACSFRFNADTCYFSPRLAEERKEIAGMVKKNEKILVMFGGVAPYAVVIAKRGKARRILSVELNKECRRYALENVKRNRVAVELVWGDVRRVLRGREKFDRIVMARPNISDSFLDIAFAHIGKKGIIHYYGFCNEDELESMKFQIMSEAKENKKKIKISKIKKAGDIGVRKYRYRFDIRVS